MEQQKGQRMNLFRNYLGHIKGRIKNRLQANTNPSCFSRLENAKQIGFSPRVIFDCGALVGNWSLAASKLFPGSRLLLVEPNEHVLDQIKEKTAQIKPEPVLVHGAVGDKTGKACLNVWDNPETTMAGSSLKEHVQGAPKDKMEVDLFTIDELDKTYKLTPDLVKLDLQGGEKEALLGATKTLQTTEMFIIEFGCLEAYIDRATPLDIMQIMYDNDYCLYDIVDLRYRPHDNALTGGDFFFVKNTSELKKHKGYR